MSKAIPIILKMFYFNMLCGFVRVSGDMTDPAWNFRQSTQFSKFIIINELV